MEKQILIRYGELTLKGKNRNDFEKRLFSNVKKQLKNYSVKVRRDRNRMYISEFDITQINDIENTLKLIPGIHSYSVAEVVELDIDKIKENAFKIFNFNKPNFRVSVKRINKQFKQNSVELEREIGAYILINNDDEKQKLKVNLKNFEQEIKIEIHQDCAYIVNEYKKAMGGLPIGTAGKALVLLSGGIDSPVAAIQAMKRGLKVDLVHFSSPPYTNEKALEKVKDLALQIQKYDSSIKLYDVHITDLQVELNMKCDASYQVILLRRMMLRVTENLCKELGAKAIITGENLSQVASQTLSSMDVTNKTIDTLILRPLLTMDKLEIIELAKDIGTYEISIRPFDDCCVLFLPKSPTTSPKIDYTLYQEQKLDYQEFIDNMKYDIFTNNELKEKDNILEEIFN